MALSRARQGGPWGHVTTPRNRPGRRLRGIALLLDLAKLEGELHTFADVLCVLSQFRISHIKPAFISSR